MANKRFELPSFDEIRKRAVGSSDKSIQRWIDTLLLDENPDVASPEDSDFETDDGSHSAAMSVTSSTNPAKPRTIKAGYDRKTKILTVVFRDGTWWEYRGVPEEMWADFQSAPSKGKFLNSSGLNSWDDMGPANVAVMPKHRRIQMSSTQELADYMYNKRKNR